MTNREAIQKFLNDKKDAIIARIPQASGRTARRMYIVADSNGGQLIGPGYIETLEDGRGPTKSGVKSKPTLREAIEEWLQYVGIPVPEGRTRRDLAYAISNSIHRRGTRLYRQGGRSGVLSGVIKENMFDSLLNDLTNINTLQAFTNVLTKFKIELKK